MGIPSPSHAKSPWVSPAWLGAAAPGHEKLLKAVLELTLTLQHAETLYIFSFITEDGHVHHRAAVITNHAS